MTVVVYCRELAEEVFEQAKPVEGDNVKQIDDNAHLYFLFNLHSGMVADDAV